MNPVTAVAMSDSDVSVAHKVLTSHRNNDNPTPTSKLAPELLKHIADIST